jgi:GMP synthase (glutamine-hydrolysing)
MHIHFIIHEHFEAPGAYEAWAKMNGHTLSYTRIYLAEPYLSIPMISIF